MNKVNKLKRCAESIYVGLQLALPPCGVTIITIRGTVGCVDRVDRVECVLIHLLLYTLSGDQDSFEGTVGA